MQRTVKLVVAAFCIAGTQAAGLRGRELTSNADAGTYVLSTRGTDLKRGEWDGSGATDFAACQAKAATAQASFFAWTDEVYQPGFCKVLNIAYNSNPDLTTDQGYGFKLFEAPGVIDEAPTPYSLQALSETRWKARKRAIGRFHALRKKLKDQGKSTLEVNEHLRVHGVRAKFKALHQSINGMHAILKKDGLSKGDINAMMRESFPDLVWRLWLPNCHMSSVQGPNRNYVVRCVE